MNSKSCFHFGQQLAGSGWAGRTSELFLAKVTRRVLRCEVYLKYKPIIIKFKYDSIGQLCVQMTISSLYFIFGGFLFIYFTVADFIPYFNYSKSIMTIEFLFIFCNNHLQVWAIELRYYRSWPIIAFLRNFCRLSPIFLLFQLTASCFTVLMPRK